MFIQYSAAKSNDMEIRLPQALKAVCFFVDILFGKWAAFAHKVIPVLVQMLL